MMRDNLIVTMPRDGQWPAFVGIGGGQYVAARPLGFSSILYRIKATWLVWTGRADALVWPAGQ